MIGNLKPYTRYKESGHSLLGQVPEHWEISKPKQIGRLLKGVGGSKEDARQEGIPCVRYGELYTTHSYFVRQAKTFVHPDRATSYMTLRYGDVLFAASGEKLDEIGKSAVNLLEGNVVCGGDVIVLRPSVPVHPPYLGYALDCYPSAVQKATMGRGTTIKHIYPDELKQLAFPLPSQEEQITIAKFLDWANGRLNRAMKAKRKVITLLTEQKQAIIHRAVTRGLDPTVALKPSGIPWRGQMPSHWEIKRLKHWVAINQRTLGEHTPPDYEFDYLDIGSVATGRLATSPLHMRFADAPSRARRLLHDGDTIISTVRTYLKAVVTVGESPRPLVASTGFAVLTPRSDTEPGYLGYVAQSAAIINQVTAESVGVAYPGISETRLSNIAVTLPPLSEQAAIVRFLDREIALFIPAISRLEREIELLREYRTRLVADVVTGKLDVREAAAQLPDEVLPGTNADAADLGEDLDIADEEATA